MSSLPLLYMYLPRRDLRLVGANKLDNRPELSEVAHTFRNARLASYVGALSLTAILIIIWPAIATVTKVMQLAEFTLWVSRSHCCVRCNTSYHAIIFHHAIISQHI